MFFPADLAVSGIEACEHFDQVRGGAVVPTDEKARPVMVAGDDCSAAALEALRRHIAYMPTDRAMDGEVQRMVDLVEHGELLMAARAAT